MSERSSCGFFKSIIDALPSKLIVPLFLLGGAAVGLGIYNIYASRFFTHFGEDPAACVNCHIMSVAYKTWERSSHGKWTTCTDCHVPHDSKIGAMTAKGKDGLRHAAVLLSGNVPAAPRPVPSTTKTIQENCVRCHTTLNTEFVNTGKAKPEDYLHGNQKACWECHRHVPHTKNSGLASAPGAVVPFPPASVAPDWLKNILQ